jgi:hypothetical protein
VKEADMTRRNRKYLVIAFAALTAAGFLLIGVLTPADAQKPSASATVAPQDVAILASGVHPPPAPSLPSNRGLDAAKTSQLLFDEITILDAVRNGFTYPPPAAPTQFVRVTRQPYRVEPVPTSLCRATPAGGPHSTHWIDVFVTRQGWEVMKRGHGVYPEGTLILKQKYSDPGRRVTELFTGMLKRKQGYNPGMGDWEFFLLDSSRASVLAFGKIESCSDCHASFRRTDFVSREYMAAVGK